jgi:hypothetical protein
MVACFSCSKTNKNSLPFDSFVYSYSAMNMEYSIKFNNSDTVYFQKRYPNPETNYYAIIKDTEKDSISALIQKIDFSKYNAIYQQDNLKDGNGFKFYTIKDNKTNSIYVYGNKAPKELYLNAAKFNEYAKRFNFQPYNGKVNFGDLSNIELPVAPIQKQPN